jgi:hypothetical protein
LSFSEEGEKKRKSWGKCGNEFPLVAVKLLLPVINNPFYSSFDCAQGPDKRIQKL